jgi:hypothetical protein
VPCESSHYDADHSDLDEGEVGSEAVFDVLGESSAAIEPAEGAFDHPAFRQRGNHSHQVKRSDIAKGFVLLPRRWVFERTLAWINRKRYGYWLKGRVSCLCKSTCHKPSWAAAGSLNLASMFVDAEGESTAYELAPTEALEIARHLLEAAGMTPREWMLAAEWCAEHAQPHDEAVN